MPTVAAPRPERATQTRLVRLLSDPRHPGWLGYQYLGDFSRRDANRNVETGLLQANLRQRGYTVAQISAAVLQLTSAAELRDDSLYQANLRVYKLLRYGAKVQVAAGQPTETVHFVDWGDVGTNDFAAAEEVTLLAGGAERRPDLVVYLNGIAVAVIELKRASTDIGEAVRQLITNQRPEFNTYFFTTVQLAVAGSDSQGLRYGTVGTPEQFYTEWPASAKSDCTPGAGHLLDRPMAELFDRERLLDLLHNFIVFDGGVKKVPRPHQYAGIVAARERIRRREGGVIWHTQGSGKSIVMVLLAKHILETDPSARVLVITDRDELDKQIEGVMRNAGVIAESSPSPRITTRQELTEKLGATTPRLLCALVHKFEPDPAAPAPPVHGSFYVFVDECHRTQGGKMNAQMRQWLPEAVFIGFTGTPLLKKDKKTTESIFGSYIHTYKFHEAVQDGVVLDLKYHARKVEQRLTMVREVDDWFAQKTRGLNAYQRSVLRKRYATLEQLSSSKERKERIIADIIHDFAVKPRLNDDRGTAILVAASIYDACHYYCLFQQTDFGQHTALITSYQPAPGAVSKESDGGDEWYKFDTYTRLILPGHSSTKDYEDKMKAQFIYEPAQTKLLIVVSKLLTGFDAPSCTYVYLDNEMRDHNLFQAICRTNRLDGADKDYGHIVDYKELFQNVEESIAVYTSDELDNSSPGKSDNVKLKDWLSESRKRLDEAREQVHYLCATVPPPLELEQYITYFCGPADRADALARQEPLRIEFYRATASLLRAYAELATDLLEAGYSLDEQDRITTEVEHYTEVRAAIKNAAGEELDVRPYERDMRHLINTYIQADPARASGQLEDYSLMELIVETSIHDAIAQKLNARSRLSRNAIAETIINNVRKTIIRDHLTDPAFYAEMSKLLEDLIARRRLISENYEDFLRSAEDLVRRMNDHGDGEHPHVLNAAPRSIVLYNNLRTLVTEGKFTCPDDDGARAQLALKLDRAMTDHAPDGWKADPDGPRGRQVQNALYGLLGKDRLATQALFELLRNQAAY